MPTIFALHGWVPSQVSGHDYRLATDAVQYPVLLDDFLTAWRWLVSQTAGRPEGGMLALGGAVQAQE